MAYIGQSPITGIFKKQSLTTDGSTTSFDLDFTVASTTSIIVSVGGVIQEPEEAYTLGGGGTSITFTAAPASTDTTYVHFLGQAVVQNLTDVNGVEFILDADADTSLTADTDDEIDIKVGGTDRSAIKTTGFHNIDSFKFVAGTGDDLQIYHDGTNSFIANSTGALKIATETSGIAVTIGHSTSEVTIADNMTVAGDLTVTGTASFGDTNITNVGSITLDSIINDGSDGVTIDSSTDVIIDAGGADIILKDDGTEFGRFSRVSSDLVIKSISNNNDILLKGVDGSSTITALQLDMSEGGDAIFSGGVSASLGKTGSFDRLEGNTLNASISPFASGSDVSQIQAQTGSYATGSDLHQFLAESASYLVDADTGSLGLLTLGNDITGSITSTASFGDLVVDGRLGIGTKSPTREFNIVSTGQVTSEFASTNAVGNLIDLVHENSANGHNGFRFYDEGTQRMGLLHVQNGTRGYIHISNTYVSGSEIVAVDGDNQNVIIGNHASKDEKLFVNNPSLLTGSQPRTVTFVPLFLL